jgi:hypothetical protein
MVFQIALLNIISNIQDTAFTCTSISIQQLQPSAACTKVYFYHEYFPMTGVRSYCLYCFNTPYVSEIEVVKTIRSPVGVFIRTTGGFMSMNVFYSLPPSCLFALFVIVGCGLPVIVLEMLLVALLGGKENRII